MSRRMRWSTMGDGGLRSARHINDVCSSDLLWHRVWAEVRRSDVSGCDVDRRWAACHGVCAGAQWATAVCDRQQGRLTGEGGVAFAHWRECDEVEWAGTR